MLKLFAPDAIHLVTEGPLGWAARASCRKHDIAFTTAYHTRFPEYVHARIRIPVAWSYAFVRRFHAPSAAVLVVAQSIRDELTQRGFKNLVPWSRGVDIAAFKPRPRPNRTPGRSGSMPGGSRSRRTSRPSSTSTCRAPSGWWEAARS